MKAYVLTTGGVFALILIAHTARIVSEGLHVAKQLPFASTSVLAGALLIWAWRLYFQLSRAPEKP